MGFCLERRGVSVSVWFLSAFDCGWSWSPFSLPLIVCKCLQCLTILECQNTREDHHILLLLPVMVIVMLLSLQVHLPHS